MEKLSWFKFTPSDWVMGKIQRCPEITQARFMRLCCIYWNKDCILTFEEADIEVDKEHLDILVSKKIIKIENDFILIEFLKDQLEEITLTSEKRRDAVNKRWAKQKGKNTSVKEKNTSVLQNDTDKSRVELEKNILINTLLSEIKISDDKKFLKIKDENFDVSENDMKYFLIAVQFQKLFIKNLKEKKSPTIKQENATYKDFVTPIRLIFEKNEATKEQLLEAYSFLNSPEGEFWKANVLTTEKLREKLPTLIAKKNTKTPIDAKKESLVPNPLKRGEF